MVFFGDSNIAKWDLLVLERKFPGALRCGVNGATMQDVAGSTSSFLRKYQPSSVVLVAGENDLSTLAPVDVLQSFISVANKISRQRVPLYYISTKPEPRTKKGGLWRQYKECND
jgi:hypothetical protein